MNPAPKIQKLPAFQGYLQISGHAVDRASLRALDIWKGHRLPTEGLHTWLRRAGKTALAQPPDSLGFHHHLGLCWAFEDGDGWPVLKTIVRER